MTHGELLLLAALTLGAALTPLAVTLETLGAAVMLAAVPAECKFSHSPLMFQKWEAVTVDLSIIWTLTVPLLAIIGPDTMLTFFAAAVQKATSLANAPTHHLAAASPGSATTAARLATTRPTAPTLVSSASSLVPATPAVSTAMLHATAPPTP